MDIIPAIDILDGKCVRLYQGDYDRKTIYSYDPVEVALRWQTEGAKRIHVVDLDGAVSGVSANFNIIKAIVASLDIPVQVGGGIRNRQDVHDLFSVGVQRVVLGTLAVEDPALIASLCRDSGANSIAVGLDAKDGKISLRGWRDISSVSALELMKDMEEIGVDHFIYTDISRDGTLTEPNFEAIREILSVSRGSLCASGGVATISHLEKLIALDVESVIVGKALYTGAIDLKQAIIHFN
jgi:phosphoribosylformimino-5-aminoimidazole carboxamide ribotide isomerase